MFNFIATALISAFGIYNYLPLSALEFLQKQESKFGATITTIQGSDTIKSSRTTINDNFTNLNNDKIENSTTSVAAITTLNNLTSASSLATVGTITSGTWTGSVIDVARQGTGTTSPSPYQVVLGNGALGLTTASSTGTTGQFLTSNGAGAYPSWQTSAVDVALDYTWTGEHGFTGATTTFSNSTTTFNSATTTWGSGQLAIGFGTSTPSLQSGISVATSTYFAGAVGIGIATTSGNTNLEVKGNTILSNASTTNLTVSNDCEGCIAYMASTSVVNVGSGTVNITPLAGARFVVV